MSNLVKYLRDCAAVTDRPHGIRLGEAADLIEFQEKRIAELTFERPALPVGMSLPELAEVLEKAGYNVTPVLDLGAGSYDTRMSEIERSSASLMVDLKEDK